MPRPPNPSRTLARDAGLKTYDDESNPCFCGATAKYVSNAQCVECAIAKGKTRYATLDDSARAALKAKDHERYITRLRRRKAPRGTRRRKPPVEIEAIDPLEP
jgi:hypothetical protein